MGIFRPLKVGDAQFIPIYFWAIYRVLFLTAIEITGFPGPPWIRIVVRSIFFLEKNTWTPGEDDPMKDEYGAFKWVGSSTNQLLLDFGWL